MQAYALYAREAYELELARIRVQLAHTRTGEFDRMVPTAEDIEHVRERIKADRTTWTSERDIEAYETDPEAQKCGRCSYLKRCTAGQDIVNLHRLAQARLLHQANETRDQEQDQGLALKRRHARRAVP